MLPQQRLNLWQACVFSAIRYGLTSVGLPAGGQDELRQVVAKQLGLVLKSPSWITHETTTAFYQRYHIEDPFLALCRLFETKQARDRSSLSAFDSDHLRQWRTLLCAHFQQSDPSQAPTSAVQLQEITQVAMQQHSCPHCSQAFPTLIALRGHITRMHAPPDAPSSKERTRRSQRSLRAEYMSLALDGMPTCKLCHRTFAAWPPFLNHHATKSCPGRSQSPPAEHSAPPDTSHDTDAASPEVAAASEPAPQPLTAATTPSSPTSSPALMHDKQIIALAQAPDWRPLAEALRARHRSQGLKHCPLCHQWFTRTQDIFRHLKKQHPLVVALETERADWLSARTVGARSPCSCCSAKASYKSQHVSACPVLQQTITLPSLATCQPETSEPSASQRMKEAEAELALLQCWGEPAQPVMMETEAMAGRSALRPPQWSLANIIARTRKVVVRGRARANVQETSARRLVLLGPVAPGWRRPTPTRKE